MGYKIFMNGKIESQLGIPQIYREFVLLEKPLENELETDKL
jgi:hypothetical protein